MDYRIVHKTKYVYLKPASLGYNEARLTPRSFARPLFNQQCLETQITVEPQWNDHSERTDFFGNQVVYFTIRQPHDQTTITATSLVQVEPVAYHASLLTAVGDLLSTRTAKNRPAPQLVSFSQTNGRAAYASPWEAVAAQLKSELDPETLDARQYILNSPLVTVFPELVDYAKPSFPPGRRILEALYDLMQRIYHDFAFVPGATTIATPLSEVLQQRRGVCQDFAHLMLGCVRAQGLAARYISGYIETLPPPGKEKMVGSDASHAWCSVYIPQLGWLDFDPTNNLIPKDQHITIAWGRDYVDVAPLKGVFFSNGRHKLSVSVDVARVAPA